VGSEAGSSKLWGKKYVAERGVVGQRRIRKERHRSLIILKYYEVILALT
jgi:hypothetical protein